eukprot:scaffold73339_cov60-Phaeocystis_antarctica.AAC.12
MRNGKERTSARDIKDVAAALSETGVRAAPPLPPHSKSVPSGKFSLNLMPQCRTKMRMSAPRTALQHEDTYVVPTAVLPRRKPV